jgi:hypothetical protein
LLTRVASSHVRVGTFQYFAAARRRRRRPPARRLRHRAPLSRRGLRRAALSGAAGRGDRGAGGSRRALVADRLRSTGS